MSYQKGLAAPRFISLTTEVISDRFLAFRFAKYLDGEIEIGFPSPVRLFT